MPYTPQTWTDNSPATPLSAARLAYIETGVDDAHTLADAAAIDSAVVHKTGTETIAGVKTFSSSPSIPTPGTTSDAATKGYVDTLVPVQSTQSGTSYTLVAGDAFRIVDTTNASAVTVTVPPNSSVAFATGTEITIRQWGAGQVTLSPGSGVTLRSRGAALKTAGQYAWVTLVKRASDEWAITGDVTT